MSDKVKLIIAYIMAAYYVIWYAACCHAVHGSWPLETLWRNML